MGSRKPYVAAFFIQITFAGMSLMSKAAFASGMSTYVFLFYRQAAGTIVLVPLTMLLKGKEKTPISLVDLCKVFVIALIGITIALDAYGVAINYTSATLGAAAFNCVPVTTFFFAVLLRMEKVNIKKAAGMAKVVGIIVCIAGAAILAFYKGPYLKPLFHHHLFHSHITQISHHQSSQNTWMIGCFFLLLTSISWGIWFVLQARFLKSFPFPLEFMCLQTVMSTVQSFIVAIVMERDPSQWKLGWDIRLLAVLYCGIFVIGIANNVQCWVIKEKGPVFQAMTTPLNLIATIIGSEVLLSEGIYLGSIIGGFLLVTSLYSVLWGKSKELSPTDNTQVSHIEASSPQKEAEESTCRIEINSPKREVEEPTSRADVNSTLV